MAQALLTKKFNTVPSFRIKGEDFVVFKKEYLRELMLLMNSFIVGEKMVKEGKSRSFNEFLKTSSRKKR